MSTQQGIGEQCLGGENEVIVHEAVEYTAVRAECNEKDGYEKESELERAEKVVTERKCDSEQREQKKGNVTEVTAELRNSEGKTGQYKRGEECTITVGTLMSAEGTADEKAPDTLEDKDDFVQGGNNNELVQSVENAREFVWTDDAYCKNLMSGWETLYRMQLPGHKRAYKAWVRDVKFQGNFRGKKKPRLPTTAEQRKERYIANRNGTHLSSDESDTDMEAGTTSDLGYPSDYKSEEDPYSDYEIYELEKDKNLIFKQRKERWLTERRIYKSKAHRNESAIQEEEK
jgi:hypothetical protein